METAVRVLCCSLAIAAALSTGASAVQGQAGDDASLQTFIKTAFYSGLIGKALSGMPSAVFQKCPSLVSKGSRIIVIKPVTFGTDGFPNGGMWRQQFPVSGCGNDTTLNLYFQATAAEKINTIVAGPGDSRADPVLQNDALTYVTIAIGGTRKDCKRFDIKTTRFESYGLVNPATPDPGPGEHSRPWWETWTMIGCGHTYDVPVDFIPDSTGTQVVQPGHIVER